MKMDAVNHWLALFANLGVILGIVFLALEINQNTRLTRAQITQSRAETSAYLAMEHANSEYIPVIRQKLLDNQPLDAIEVERYNAFLRAALRVQDNNYQQYQMGLLGEYAKRTAKGFIEGLIAPHQQTRRRWEDTKWVYSDAFIVFADDVLEEYDSAPPNE